MKLDKKDKTVLIIVAVVFIFLTASKLILNYLIDSFPSELVHRVQPLRTISDSLYIIAFCLVGVVCSFLVYLKFQPESKEEVNE